MFQNDNGTVKTQLHSVHFLHIVEYFILTGVRNRNSQQKFNISVLLHCESQLSNEYLRVT